MLSISELTVVGTGGRTLLEKVSLTLEKKDRVCLTGASGAGKSTLIKAILGVGENAFAITDGDIQIDGKSILTLTKQERRALCGSRFGFIPQNSMTAFFSGVKIGKQLTETYRMKLGLKKAEARQLALDTLEKVNLTDAQRVMEAYPSQLSGGMLQRAAMSMILGMKPEYILADEPTSALDRNNRAHIIRLLEDYHDGGVLFISHDAEAIRQLCSFTCVLENGKLTEARSTPELFSSPRRDWTKRFVEAALTNQEETERWKRLW